MLLKTKIVGVLNLTPDSFSDGRTYTKDELKTRINELIQDGADIIDVGAESTAPNSPAISYEEELVRLQDFFSICKEFTIPFSLDTMKSQIAEKGIKLGIKIINDVSGGRYDPEMLPLISHHPRVKYIMMYSKNPYGRADREARVEGDIMEIITKFFDQQINIATNHGIKRSQLILDPGMGAFISPDYHDSVTILQQIKRLKKQFKLPLLLCPSRKGFLSKIIPDQGPQDRLGSSLATSIFAITQGAQFIRVHDVKEMRQFMQVWNELQGRVKG